MDKKFIENLYQARKECPDCPSPGEVSDLFQDLLGVLFPDFSKESFDSIREFELHIERLRLVFKQMFIKSSVDSSRAEELAGRFFEQLPFIHQKLSGDVSAMFNGDPAAKSEREVIRTYPGFFAIAAYRIAHVLHQLKIDGIPRIITECAHSKTGIDIHPGAKIGNYFCIDHGTGIVIGETCVIGDHVKIYQGVTLGAVSINKEDATRKRHPTIEDHVVIYAGATILGGESVVGHHSIIGGNVWLTRSIPPYSKVYYQTTMVDDEGTQADQVVIKTARK